VTCRDPGCSACATALVRAREALARAREALERAQAALAKVTR